MKILHLAFLAPLLVFSTLASEKTETISVTDFGAKPGASTDSTPAFAKALSYAQSHPGCTILIPAGQFYLNTTMDASDMPLPDRYHLRTANLKGVTIQGAGTGSEILFGEYAAGIIFERCSDLTIRNVTFDYAFPLFSQGKVVGYSPAEHTLLLKSDPDYPVPETRPNTIFANAKASWLTLNKTGMRLFYFGALFADKTILEKDDVQYVVSPELGNGRIFVDGGATLLKDVRYTRVARNAGQLLRLNFCSQVTVENVSIYAASGFALLGCMCEDVTIRNCRIEPRPGSDRMISTCADGLHFIGGRGEFVIEDNVFDSLQDDNVNIILRGNSIDASPAPNVLKLTPASTRYYAVGDTLRIYDCVHSTYTDYTITSLETEASSKIFPAQYTLTLDRPVTDSIVYASEKNKVMPSMVYDMSWSFGDVTIRHNKFLNNRARGVRIAASGVKVEDNFFELSAYPSIIAHSIIRDTWFDEGLSFPNHITIQNNTLIRSQNNGGCTGNLGAICVEVRDDGKNDLAVGCRFLENITITGNNIRDSGRAGIACFNTSTLRIEDNKIFNPGQLSAPGTKIGIIVRNARDSIVENNVITGKSLNRATLVENVTDKTE